VSHGVRIEGRRGRQSRPEPPVQVDEPRARDRARICGRAEEPKKAIKARKSTVTLQKKNSNMLKDEYGVKKRSTSETRCR
jgi:hypothetical protein